MKRIILLLLMFNCAAGFAQLGAKLSLIRPTGNFGSGVKPAPGAELILKPFEDPDETAWNVRFGLGFAKFAPRLDTFPTYGVIMGGGTTVTPGYTVIHKYNIITLTAGLDYMIRLSDALRVYPGMDVGALFTSTEYSSYAPLIISEGYSGGSVFISARLRAGIEYLVTEDIGVFAEAVRSMNFSPELGGLGYNDYGIGFRLNF